MTRDQKEVEHLAWEIYRQTCKEADKACDEAKLLAEEALWKALTMAFLLTYEERG